MNKTCTKYNKLYYNRQHLCPQIIRFFKVEVYTALNSQDILIKQQMRSVNYIHGIVFTIDNKA